MAKLFVIIQDRLSELIKKGEITERYYNPGNLFDEVHIIMTNDDLPDKSLVQKTVGNANLYLHNLPANWHLLLRSLGWRPCLLKGFVKRAIQLARELNPTLIRCHANHLNAFVAYSIKKELGIPYIISLHTNPDENRRLWTNGSIKEKIYANAIKSIEHLSLKNADRILPVYRSLIPYLTKLKIVNYEVCYNTLNPTNLIRKTDYSHYNPVKLISVGRQIPGKNPENIIRALALMENTTLTLIGDGSLHGKLLTLSKELGLTHRINFINSLDNDSLCAILHNFDIFVAHCDYGGIPKTIMEAFLVGMPVILNTQDKYIPEIHHENCILTDNSIQGYYDSINELMNCEELRQELGQKGYKYASDEYSPLKAEQKFISIYRSVLKDSSL